MKKDTKVYLVLVVVVIAIIIVIGMLKANGLNEETAKCIASNSQLIVSKTCGHCAQQKAMFGEYIGYFELLDLGDNPELWNRYSLIGVPTWIINNQTYAGVHSIEELKEFTGC